VNNAVPRQAWVVTFAGMAVNLCLGILYAWSVWKKSLLAPEGTAAGSPMSGLNQGWAYLTSAESTWALTLCGLIFAITMIPGGKIQDRFGPSVGATLGGLFLAAGCVVAGYMQSFTGLIIGFGILGGIGMGLGYAAATPAAVKWFGPHQRGLVVGMVVAGYGGAAIYISPLAQMLIDDFGISGSFYALGGLFAVVIVVAAQLLTPPPDDYVPPAPPTDDSQPKPVAAAPGSNDWSAIEMLGAWQFYALMFLFIASAQSGLLVINNATPILAKVAKGVAFLAANVWLLSAFGGFVNAAGRIGTGLYSDRIGRGNAYLINAAVAAACVFVTPMVIAGGNLWLLFLVLGVAYWQYGGGLALLPAYTADFFGAKNLGFNYGLVFLGWGIAFVIPLVASYIEDVTGSLDNAFYLSGGLLIAGLILSCFVRKPTKAE